MRYAKEVPDVLVGLSVAFGAIAAIAMWFFAIGFLDTRGHDVAAIIVLAFPFAAVPVTAAAWWAINRYLDARDAKPKPTTYPDVDNGQQASTAYR